MYRNRNHVLLHLVVWFLCGKPARKGSLGSFRGRWEDNLNSDLKKYAVRSGRNSNKSGHNWVLSSKWECFFCMMENFASDNDKFRLYTVSAWTTKVAIGPNCNRPIGQASGVLARFVMVCHLLVLPSVILSDWNYLTTCINDKFDCIHFAK
jgi:hypothetical protein